MTKKQTMKRFCIALAMIITLVLPCCLYLGNYYHADLERMNSFAVTGTVEMQKDPQGNLIFAPEDATTGLIFYPGGKVEHSAYVPLMQTLCAKGIHCILIEMPFRLAVFDINAADDVCKQFPQIENWYIAGHSLGGAMAASYVSDHAEHFRGLVLLGAYSTADLTQTDLGVLSVFGSEDLVMNQEKYKESKENYPDDFTEVVIQGGCHSQFGMYGPQDGDGSPTVTNEMQIKITAEEILKFIRRIDRAE